MPSMRADNSKRQHAFIQTVIASQRRSLAPLRSSRLYISVAALESSNKSKLCASSPPIDNRTRHSTTMDVKEVELRGKAINKAISEKEPSSSLLKLLSDLDNGLKPTEDLLRQTRIGVTINKLRTHNDPAVASLANKMVSKWREEVNKQKKGAARPKAPMANGTASPAPASGTQSPMPNKKKHNVDPEKRSHKTDNVKYQVTGVDARDACVRLMYDGLAFMSEDRKYLAWSYGLALLIDNSSAGRHPSRSQSCRSCRLQESRKRH